MHVISLMVGLVLVLWCAGDGMALAADLVASPNPTTSWPSPAVFAVGAVAPFALALVISVELGVRLAAAGSYAPRLLRAIVGTLRDARDEAPVGALASAAAAAVLAVTWLVAATVLGSALITIVRNSLYAALAVLLTGASGALLGLAAWAPIAALLERAVLPLGRTRLAARLGPVRIVAVLLGALAVALLAAVALVGAGRLAGLPWVAGASPVVALLVAALIAGRTRRGLWERAPAAASAALVGGLLAASALAWWGPDRGSAFAPSWRGRVSLARPLIAVGDHLLDVDGDRSLDGWGGDDCAPWDPRRGGRQREIPGNGVDEDCSGRDAVSFPAAEQRGRARHGRPTTGVAASPTVVLITTDALSSDSTGLGDPSRELTPELDAWAARATIFDLAFTTSSATIGAIPALLTGRYAPTTPGLLPVDSIEEGAHARAPTLPELLRSRGYRSAAVTGAAFFASERWPSLAAVFDLYDETPVRELGPAPASLAHKRYTGARVTDRAIEILDAHRGVPLFLWIHYFDHHLPYEAPPGTARGATPRDRYRAEVRWTDVMWGRLLRDIEARFEPEEVVVVFSADHGEGLDGVSSHNTSCRVAEARVPLVIQTAHGRGRRVGGLASHLDVTPTVLDLVGIDPPPGLVGESLVPALVEGVEPQKGVAFCALWIPGASRLGGPALRAAGLYTRELALLERLDTGERTLIAHQGDAEGRENLLDARPAEAEWARLLLDEELAAMGLAR